MLHAMRACVITEELLYRSSYPVYDAVATPLGVNQRSSYCVHIIDTVATATSQ